MPKEEEMMKALSDIAAEDAPKVQEGLEAVTKNIFEYGMMPKDALGIRDADSEYMYAQGYQLYNMGKYKDARSLFATLMMMDATEPKYIFGHAACSHMLKDYDAAADAYTKQAMLVPDDPIPYYHAADCYIKMKDKFSSLVALNLVIKRSGDKPEFQTIKERSELTAKRIQNDIEVEGIEGAPEKIEEEEETSKEKEVSKENKKKTSDET